MISAMASMSMIAMPWNAEMVSDVMHVTDISPETME